MNVTDIIEHTSSEFVYCRQKKMIVAGSLLK